MKVEFVNTWAYAPEPGVTCRYKPGPYEVGMDIPASHAQRALDLGAAREVKEAPQVETKTRKRRTRKAK
jgi:hypothetical protein